MFEVDQSYGAEPAPHRKPSKNVDAGDENKSELIPRGTARCTSTARRGREGETEREGRDRRASHGTGLILPEQIGLPALINGVIYR